MDTRKAAPFPEDHYHSPYSQQLRVVKSILLPAGSGGSDQPVE